MADQLYDFTAWQQRLNLTTKQAAEAMDVSESFLHQLKREGKGRKLYAWAAYGIEQAASQKP